MSKLDCFQNRNCKWLTNKKTKTDTQWSEMQWKRNWESVLRLSENYTNNENLFNLQVLQGWYSYLLERRHKKARTAGAMERRRARLVRGSLAQWLSVADHLASMRKTFAVQQQAQVSGVVVLWTLTLLWSLRLNYYSHFGYYWIRNFRKNYKCSRENERK